VPSRSLQTWRVIYMDRSVIHICSVWDSLLEQIGKAITSIDEFLMNAKSIPTKTTWVIYMAGNVTHVPLFGLLFSNRLEGHNLKIDGPTLNAKSILSRYSIFNFRWLEEFGWGCQILVTFALFFFDFSRYNSVSGDSKLQLSRNVTHIPLFGTLFWMN